MRKLSDQEAWLPRFLCTISLSLSVCLSPFFPSPPLRALHSFAQLMKINESKNVAYSFPLVSSRLLPILVGFALFSFPFFLPLLLCSALLWVLHALIYIARRSTRSCRRRRRRSSLFISKQRRRQREQSKSRRRRRCVLC